jgi:hypothetical protein
MQPSPAEREKERFWNLLLGLIGKGTVVPVVGEDLLQVEGDLGLSICEALAVRYAKSCDIILDPLEQRNLLSAVVTRHKDFFRNPHDVYSGVGDEYALWGPPIPESLRALARIRHFNLFVSTTFDDLLERALNQERFGGKNLTEVISYSPKCVPDERQISSQLASGRPVVFQIFGNCQDPLRYALTEGDKVEYVHALQTAEYRPARILSELYDRPLLLLGNRFPDWLTRIFLRLVRKTPLNNVEVPKQYVSDAGDDERAPKHFFLNHFATNTEVIENLTPIEVVAELSSRWQQRFGGSPIETVTITSGPRPMPKGAIFISYCATDSSGRPSPDGPRAVALRDALEKLSMDVWFDKDQLQGGDEFERKIQRYINTCSIFMPLISGTTESRDDGFFRKEWNWALARLQEFTGSDRQFVYPIVLDKLNPYEAKVPDGFKRFQFATMLGPGPDAQLVNHIHWLYQRARPEVPA